MMDVDRQTFAGEVRAGGDHLSPARAALLFAREVAYPDLRPSEYLGALDDLAGAARRHMDGSVGPEPEARTWAMSEFLAQFHGFRGDTQDYYDPRNLYLNQVIDRRLGIPITLSVVWLEVGRRLGLPLTGVGLPGHFIVALDTPDGPRYLDPYHGGIPLSLEDCAQLVRQSSGYQGAFKRAWLAPTGPRAIVERMLNNARNVYMRQEDWGLAAAVVERLRQLRPDVATHLRDLGLLFFRQGALRQASEHLSRYLAADPEAADSESVRESRDMLLEHLARLN